MAASLLQKIGRRAALDQLQGGQARERGVFPAPSKGWNARDNIAQMGQDFAVELVNYFPERGVVTLRNGSVVRAETGETDPIETLISAPDGDLYGVLDDTLIRLLPEVSAELRGNMTRSRWQTAWIGGHVVCVNGADTPFTIDADGTIADWSATGPDDIATLVQLQPHKGRLWAVEEGTATLWYGAQDAYTGALSKFDLQYVHPQGGEVLACGTLTLDSGAGIDDLLVIAMASGHILAYAGTDPDTADTWRLAGTFDAPAVIGRRPFAKLGGDLVAVTRSGYVSILALLRGSWDADVLTLSDAILGAVREDVELFGSEDGWEIVLHGPAHALICNIPSTIQPAHQHVQNIQTRAWCRWEGLDAACWAVHDGRLYYGSRHGTLVEANVPGSNEEIIYARAKTAFSYLGTPEQKKFQNLRPHVSVSGPVQFRFGLGIDFFESADTPPPVSLEVSESEWDTADWETSTFAGSVLRQTWWQDLRETGTAANITLETRTRGIAITWYGAEILYERTAGLF